MREAYQERTARNDGSTKAGYCDCTPNSLFPDRSNAKPVRGPPVPSAHASQVVGAGRFQFTKVDVAYDKRHCRAAHHRLRSRGNLKSGSVPAVRRTCASTQVHTTGPLGSL